MTRLELENSNHDNWRGSFPKLVINDGYQLMWNFLSDANLSKPLLGGTISISKHCSISYKIIYIAIKPSEHTVLCTGKGKPRVYPYKPFHK